jgi:formiminoglutamase/agmatinase
VGVRGFNYPDQFDYVAKNAVVHIPASQFHNMGASEAARQSMMVAAADQAHVFLTVDIDVLDPCSGPGSGADEPGGLSTSELLSFVREVAPSIDAMDVTEINPLRDRNDATSTVGAYLVMLTVVSRAAAG